MSILFKVRIITNNGYYIAITLYMYSWWYQWYGYIHPEWLLHS